MLFACKEILSVANDLTNSNVKDLEFLLCQMHQPWAKSDHGDSRDVFEQMKQRRIWVFDREAKICNFMMLVEYMNCIQRHDLGQRLRDLGKV